MRSLEGRKVFFFDKRCQTGTWCLWVVSRQVTQHHLALLRTPRSLDPLQTKWVKFQCQVTKAYQAGRLRCTHIIAISLRYSLIKQSPYIPVSFPQV